jgi:predicted site-specific integrase-resolvase
VKLSAWAKNNSLSYRRAYDHFKRGQIEGAYALPTGTIVIPEKLPARPDLTVVYARVSSAENKPNLESQADRVSQFCAAKGWTVNMVVKECASGLNDSRPKLQKVLKNPAVTRIVVEHKDRLTRFGFEYLKTLFHGEIVVVNEVKADDQDLMQDFVSLVTSFCARLYGHRRSRRKTERLIAELKSDQDKIS